MESKVKRYVREGKPEDSDLTCARCGMTPLRKRGQTNGASRLRWPNGGGVGWGRDVGRERKAGKSNRQGNRMGGVRQQMRQSSGRGEVVGGAANGIAPIPESCDVRKLFTCIHVTGLLTQGSP